MSDIVYAGDGDYDRKPRFFKVALDLTEKCPFACSYCYERAMGACEERTLRFDDARTILAKLKGIGETQPLRITFFGGEPLSHPDFLEIVALGKRLMPNAVFCATSNVYKSEDFIKELYSIAPDFHINYSVHFEYVNSRNALKKIELLSSLNPANVYNVIYLPEKRQEARKLIEDSRELLGAQRNRLYVKFIRTKESNYVLNLPTYTEEDYRYIDRSPASGSKFFIVFKNGTELQKTEYFFGDNSPASTLAFKGLYCTYPMYYSNQLLKLSMKYLYY